jgi:hypothetical protein
MQTPAPQGAPTTQGPSIYVPATPGSEAITIPAPRTAREIDALKRQRSELSSQLNSVDGRRKKLMEQLRQTSDPTATKGLQDRLALLDNRQLQLETDIAQTGQALSSASAGLVGSTSVPVFLGVLSSNQVMGLSVLSIIFVLSPLAVGIGRAIFRRSNKPAIPPQVINQTAERLERLESSIDAIAIEVERISEGQRFVTKLLSDGQAAPMLGSGQRSPEPARASGTTK